MTELYRRRFPAAPEAVPTARHEVIDAIVRSDLADAPLRAEIALAVTEAVSNAVQHAYPSDGAKGHMEISVTCTDDRLTVTVSDHGRGLGSVPSTAGAGLGLFIMRAQAQDVTVKSGTSGTTVGLHFRVCTRAHNRQT